MKKQKHTKNQSIRAHQRVFIFTAVTGLVFSMFGSGITAYLQAPSVSASNGWSWNLIEDSSSGLNQSLQGGESFIKDVSADGQHIIWTKPMDQYAGIKLSHDGGATWSITHPSGVVDQDPETSESTSQSYEAVAISDEGTTIYVVERDSGGADPMIRKSTDGGATWVTASLLPVDSAGFYGVYSSFKTSSDGARLVLYVDCNGTMCIFKSSDSGATWSQIDQPGDQDWLGTELTSSGDLQTIVLINKYNSEAPTYVSKDGGQTFEEKPTIAAYLGLSISTDGETMMAIDSSDVITISDDGGVTWENRTPVTDQPEMYWDIIRMSEDGTKVFAMSYQDIYNTAGNLYAYVSADSGLSWTRSSSTAFADVVQSIPMNAYASPVLYLANNGQDVRMITGLSMSSSSDAGANWQVYQELDGINAYQTSSVSSKIYGTFSEPSYFVGTALYESDDFGKTWDKVAIPVNPDCVMRSVGISKNGQHIYGNGFKMFTYENCTITSSDGGLTWSEPIVVTDDVSGKIFVSNDGSTVVVHPINGGALKVSRDNGQTWLVEEDPSTYIPSISLNALSMSDDGNTIMVVNGFMASKQIMLTTDGGATWTYPDDAIDATTVTWKVGAVSGDGSTIYVGGSGSDLFVSRDGGVTWTTLPGARPQPWSSYWSMILVSSDGQRIIINNGDDLMTSLDGGATWAVQAEVTDIYRDDYLDEHSFMLADGSAIYLATSEGYYISEYGFLPGPVSNVITTSLEGAVEVVWESASVVDPIGDPVLDYRLQYRQVDSGTAWATVSGITGLSYTVENLTPGVQYEFKVQARTKLGYNNSPTAVYELKTHSTLPFLGVSTHKDTTRVLAANDDGTVVVLQPRPTSFCNLYTDCPDSTWSMAESTDYGQTFTTKNGNLSNYDRFGYPTGLAMSGDGTVRFVTSLAMDDSAGHARFSIWRSGDSGTTWQEVYGFDAEDVATAGVLNIENIKTSNNGQYIYGRATLLVGESGSVAGLIESHDGGSTWNTRPLANVGDPMNALFSIHPLDTGEVWLNYMYYDQSTPMAKVVSSIDNGATWTDITDRFGYSPDFIDYLKELSPEATQEQLDAIPAWPILSYVSPDGQKGLYVNFMIEAWPQYFNNLLNEKGLYTGDDADPSGPNIADFGFIRDIGYTQKSAFTANGSYYYLDYDDNTDVLTLTFSKKVGIFETPLAFSVNPVDPVDPPVGPGTPPVIPGNPSIPNLANPDGPSSSVGGSGSGAPSGGGFGQTQPDEVAIVDPFVKEDETVKSPATNGDEVMNEGKQETPPPFLSGAMPFIILAIIIVLVGMIVGILYNKGRARRA